MEWSSLSAGQRVAVILELLGASKFNEEAAGAGASMRKLGVASEEAGLAMGTASKRTWAQNQALYTLRRYAFYATIALTAVGGTLAKWGFDYYTTIQQANIAFTTLLKSQTRAKTFVDSLYILAAKTPYTFAQVTDAARKFISIGGLTSGQATKAIKALGDNLAIMGNYGSQSISRATLQLVHMLSIGKLTGQVLLNLQRDNVAILQALEEHFHATGLQIRQAVSAGLISSQQAIVIWQNYVQKHWGGTAENLTKKSLPLMWTTFRDFMSRLAYLFERPVFDKLTIALSHATSAIQGAGDLALKTGGSWQVAINYLDKAAHLHGVLASQIGFFINVLKAGWAILKAVFTDVVIVLMLMRPLFAVLGFFLGQMSKHTTILEIVLLPLVASWITWHLLLLATEGPLKILIWSYRVLTGAMIKENVVLAWKNNLMIRQKLATIALFLWTNRLKTATVLWTRAMEMTNWNAEKGFGQYPKYNTILDKMVRLIRGRLIPSIFALTWIETASGGTYVYKNRVIRLLIGTYEKMVRFIRASLMPTIGVLTAELWADNAAWYANPITWVVVGLAATAAFIILYYRWKKFHDIVNETFQWFKHNEWWLYFIPIVQPLVTAYNVIIEIKNIIQDIINLIRHPLDWKKWLNVAGISTKGGFWNITKSIGKNFLGPFPGSVGLIKHLIPGHQYGGITAGGPVLVGERGPEILWPPKGSMVQPISHQAQPAIATTNFGNGSYDQPIVVQVMLDRKVLAQAVAHTRQDAAARR